MGKLLSKENLKNISKPLMCNKAYFRPFICNGDLNKADIFLVGINPATPIFPEEIDLDSYIDLILDYDKFIKFYKKRRLDSSKREISRTRIGMNSLINWIHQCTGASILETDVIPYPTLSLKELKKESNFIKEYGKEIFINLILELQPSLLIFYGKKSIEYASEAFTRYSIDIKKPIDLDMSIEDMENRPVLTEIDYGNKTGIIMACRHLMYYGKDGETFNIFKGNVLDILKKLGSNNR